MFVGLPSFYFPLREDDGIQFFRTLLTTTNGRSYTLSSVVIFFSLMILGGHIGVPIILVTLYVAEGVRRHPMLVNFLITWFIYSTSFCVLLYTGKQFGPEPSHGLCAFQASLIYGTAVMTPTAGLSFVLNLWFSLRAVTENKSIVSNHSLRNLSLIVAPHVVFVAFVIFTTSYGAVNSELLSRNRYLFYCTINSRLVDIVPATAALIMLLVIVFEGKSCNVSVEILVAIKLYRMHKAFISMRTNGGPPLQLIVRVGIFSLYSFLAIVACISFWSKTGAELPYIIQASLPTAAFIIFGTQRDLLESWGLIRLWHLIVKKPQPIQVIEIPNPKPLLGA